MSPLVAVTWRRGDPVDFGAMEESLPVMRAALERVGEALARIGVRVGDESEIYAGYQRARGAAEQYLLYYGSKVRGEHIRSRGAIRVGGPTLEDLDQLREATFGDFFRLAAALTGIGPG